MKKISLVLAVMLVLAMFVGCSTTQPSAAEQSSAAVSESQSATQQEDTATETANDGQITVAYAQGELVNAWRVCNQADMKSSIEAAGWNFITTDANQDPSKQLSDIENLLAQKPDYIVVSPIESEALAPAVDMCDKAGVPMIVIDRTLNAEVGGMYKTVIAQSHVISGKELAKRTVELLTEKYGEPKGNVVHVQGQSGASPVIDANSGWDEVMADYPNIKTVATEDAGFTKEGGMKVMENFLTAYPAGQIDIVRSDYSDMTMGAIDAIKNAGRDELLGFIVGEGGHIKCIEAVVNGEIACETQTPPFFGAVVVETINKLMAGEEVPAYQEVPIQIFTTMDIDTAKAYLDAITAAGSEF